MSSNVQLAGFEALEEQCLRLMRMYQQLRQANTVLTQQAANWDLERRQLQAMNENQTDHIVHLEEELEAAEENAEKYIQKVRAAGRVDKKAGKKLADENDQLTKENEKLREELEKKDEEISKLKAEVQEECKLQKESLQTINSITDRMMNQQYEISDLWNKNDDWRDRWYGEGDHSGQDDLTRWGYSDEPNEWEANGNGENWHTSVDDQQEGDGLAENRWEPSVTENVPDHDDESLDDVPGHADDDWEDVAVEDRMSDLTMDAAAKGELEDSLGEHWL
jgi:hypothetical protein